jgi:hypothetical protein
MYEQSAAPKVSRRRFLAAAGTVTAASSLTGTASAMAQPVPQPPVRVDHPVTIHPTPNNNLSYTEGANGADPLTVDPNKSVTWQVNTPGKKYHVTILFENKRTPFVGPNGKPVHAFHGTEQDEGTLTVGGMIGPTTGTYRYAVAVFDDVTKETYSDDPKIIVGTGFDEARDALTAALEEVKEADVALSGRPKQQEQAKSIEHQLENLIGELK